LTTILAPIDDVVAWIITHLFSAFSPVFGLTSGVTWLLTIVVLVVLMRLILVPLFIKQMHTQRAMTALAPRITELRKRYKGDKERLNQETMKLYQEAGVNPLMGCLPVLLQMPIFFALFSVLRYIAEWTPKIPLHYGLTRSLIVSAQHAKIFGATIADKVLFTGTVHVPLHAKIVILVAVMLSMTTTYLTVRQSMKRGMMPTATDSPMGQSQKMMAYVMPLFALTGLYWQFGLVLYWVTTNVWTLGQQFVLLRKYPVGVAVLPTGGKSAGRAIGRPATAPGLTSGPSRPGLRGTGRTAPGKVSDEAAKADSGKADSGKAYGGKVDTGKADGGKADGGKADGGKVDGGKVDGGTAAGTGRGGTAKGAADRKPGASAQGAAGGKGGKSSPQDAPPPRTSLSKARGSGSDAASGSNGHKPTSGDGGVLRRFGRGRPAPEPPVPAQPETKVVRQQPQRQSRSKRSGKR